MFKIKNQFIIVVVGIIVLGSWAALCGILLYRKSPTTVDTQPDTKTINLESLSANEYIKIGQGRIERVAYSPDGNTLAVDTSMGIALYDTTYYRLQRFIPTGSWSSNVIWSPDSKLLAVEISTDLFLFEVSTSEQILMLANKEDAMVGKTMAWSKDGKYIASTAEMLGHTDVWIWEVETGNRVKNLKNTSQHYPHATGLSWSSDGNYIAVSYWYGSFGLNFPGGNIFIWDLADKPKVIRQWELNDWSAGKLEWLSNGQTILAADSDHLMLFDASDGSLLAEQNPTSQSGSFFSLLPDERFVLTGNKSPQVIYEIPSSLVSANWIR